jgi:hypothetical protein
MPFSVVIGVQEERPGGRGAGCRRAVTVLNCDQILYMLARVETGSSELPNLIGLVMFLIGRPVLGAIHRMADDRFAPRKMKERRE